MKILTTTLVITLAFAPASAFAQIYGEPEELYRNDIQRRIDGNAIDAMGMDMLRQGEVQDQQQQINDLRQQLERLQRR